jgi:antitoxin component YwqK of YwqJK toxin-antitoxin module
MIIKYLSLLLLLTISFSGFSQKNKKKKYNRIYTDENMKEKLRHVATFYIDRESLEYNHDYEIYIRRTYYMDKVFFENCTIRYDKSGIERLYKIGKQTRYYRNGNIESETNYVNGKATGNFMKSYENGVLKTIGRHDSINKIYIYSYSDSLGNNFLNEGTGEYSEFSDYHKSNIHYVIIDSLIQASYFIDNIKKDTLYLITNKPIEPVNGWKHFYEKLRFILIEADVTQFGYDNFNITGVINEEGIVEDVKVIKSRPSNEDEKVINLFKNAVRFHKPVLLNGKSVKVWISIPFILM